MKLNLHSVVKDEKENKYYIANIVEFNEIEYYYVISTQGEDAITAFVFVEDDYINFVEDENLLIELTKQVFEKK